MELPFWIQLSVVLFFAAFNWQETCQVFREFKRSKSIVSRVVYAIFLVMFIMLELVLMALAVYCVWTAF